jgi:hypothetical protein
MGRYLYGIGEFYYPFFTGWSDTFRSVLSRVVVRQLIGEEGRAVSIIDTVRCVVASLAILVFPLCAATIFFRNLDTDGARLLSIFYGRFVFIKSV